MSRETSLKSNELLLLDTLVYFAQLSNKDFTDKDDKKNSYMNIGNFIQTVKDNKEAYNTVFNNRLGYTDEELGMDKIIELIDKDKNGTLKRLVMVYPDTQKDTTTSSVCLVDPETSDVYVIYVGNYNNDPYKYYMNEEGWIDISSWIENIMGAVVADTDEQKRNLDFYNESIEAARKYLKNDTEDLHITVSGHSTGGNNAQYVTIAYNEDLKEYKAINDIDECVSFDGQGFSTSFLEKYSEAIENRADKITSFCPNVSIVGALMNDIPGIEQNYIDIGKPNTKIIGYHMPAEMLDEYGNFKAECTPSVEYALLKFYSTSSIDIASVLPGVDIDNAMNGLGKLVNVMINGDEEDKSNEIGNIIHNKDAWALLGVLTTELTTTELAVGVTTKNEIESSIIEIEDLLEKGKIEQAVNKATETICKINFGLRLYTVGHITGNPIIATTNFIIGWNLGKLEHKIGTTITREIYEAAIYVGKEIYEAGVGAYEAGKKAGKYVKNKLNKLWDNVCDALGICDDDYKSASSVHRYIPDPLVIDLDFDGFELKNVEDGVFFDNDNKGHVEKTQWVSSDDGLLALDLNMDGLINDGSELFGTSTVMPDGTLAKSGFEALSQYDDNNDGVIDEEDKVYEKLLVWQDKNSNGISEADELKTLKDMGIKSISLNAGTVDGVNSSMINYNDGTSGKIGEFSFDAQLYNVVEKESIEISEEIKELPDIDAIGNVASLHTLMQSDTTGTLIEYVKNFASSTEPSEKEKLVTDILYFITGANEVSSGSRGGEFDAKKLKVIEEFMGRKFVGTNGANPVNSAAPILNNIYNNIFELYYNMLNGETALKDYLAMTYVKESE
ncbi:MAG: DUF2974 domain-containing protein, partial [Lachnospiraceae bacterium]|nr:DUF2974 domain-containing protein [Lachnospiraceae bacterium]